MSSNDSAVGVGLCECGCGQPVGPRTGHVSTPKRFVRGHSLKHRHGALIDRFLAKVEEDEATGCWLWTGAKRAGGYGHFREDGVSVLAHRWSYQYHRGYIGEALTIDHLCRTPACVNPSHMELVTIAENIKRRGASSRWGGQ